jgi:hypothetical protein
MKATRLLKKLVINRVLLPVSKRAYLDKFAGINKMTARVKKAFNGKLPQELNAELAAALIAGVPDSAKQIAKDTYKAMRDVAGDISDDLIDSY